VRVRYLHADSKPSSAPRSSAICAGQVRRAGGHPPAARGLDMPEVALVAILDADKEGFPALGNSLIQTNRARPPATSTGAPFCTRPHHWLDAARDRQTDRRRAPGQIEYNATPWHLPPRGISQRASTDIMEGARLEAPAPRGAKRRHPARCAPKTSARSAGEGDQETRAEMFRKARTSSSRRPRSCVMRSSASSSWSSDCRCP